MRIAAAIALLLVSIAGTGTLAVSSASTSPPSLFSPATLSPADGRLSIQPHPGRRRTLRTEIVVADAGLLARNPAVLALNLFSNGNASHVTLVASRTRTRRTTGLLIWEGIIESDPLSSVTFVVANGLVSGAVRTLNATFLVAPRSGVTAIWELDGAAFPPEADAIVPVVAASVPGKRQLSVPPSDPGIGSTSPVVIDVLILYTPAVALAAGSLSSLTSDIHLAVAEANRAYRNSQIPITLNLVGIQRVTYTEGGDMRKDLDKLTDMGDGIMDEVHGLRDRLGADLVSLWTMDIYLCGIGWTMRSDLIGTGFAKYGFSVVDYSCATGSLSFVHEMGHNAGGLLG